MQVTFLYTPHTQVKHQHKDSAVGDITVDNLH